MILDTGRRFDAAGDIDRIGLERRGLGDVIRIQAARDEDAA